MRIEKEILSSHFKNAVAEQIKKDYENRGYKVELNVKLNGYNADLTAKKDDKTKVFVIRTSALSPEKRDQFDNLRKYAKLHPDCEIEVVFAFLPRDKEIEIDQISDVLFDWFSSRTPDELTELSAQINIDEVHNIILQRLHIKPDNTIHVEGTGTVDVELHFDLSPQNEFDGKISYAAIPFEFNLALAQVNGELRLKEVLELEVDTSGYVAEKAEMGEEEIYADS